MEDEFWTPRLKFGNVVIHEFGAAIGHNPSVSQGVPIALSDTELSSQSMPLETYERNRAPRRTTRQLIISKGLRAQILLREGYSLEEIEEATKECLQKRWDRKKSYNSKNWDGVTEKLESTKRQISKIVKRRSSPPKDDLRRVLDLNSDRHCGSSSISHVSGNQRIVDSGPAENLCRSSSNDCLSTKRATTEPLKIPVRRESLITSPLPKSSETSPIKPQRRASGFLKAENGRLAECVGDTWDNPDNSDEHAVVQRKSTTHAVAANNADGCHGSKHMSCIVSKHSMVLPFSDDHDTGRNETGVRIPTRNMQRNFSTDSALSPRMPQRRKSVECTDISAVKEKPLHKASTRKSTLTRRPLSFLGSEKGNWDFAALNQAQGSIKDSLVDAETILKQAVTGRTARRDSILSGLSRTRRSRDDDRACFGGKEVIHSVDTVERVRRRSSFFGGSESSSTFSESPRDCFRRSASLDRGMGITHPFGKSVVVIDDTLNALEYEPMYMPGDSEELAHERQTHMLEQPSSYSSYEVGYDVMSESDAPVALTRECPAVRSPLPHDSSETLSQDTFRLNSDRGALSLPPSILRIPKYSMSPSTAPKAGRRSSFFGTASARRNLDSRSKLTIRKPERRESIRAELSGGPTCSSNDSPPQPVLRRISFRGSGGRPRSLSLEPPLSLTGEKNSSTETHSVDGLKMPARRASLVKLTAESQPERVDGGVEESYSNNPKHSDDINSHPVNGSEQPAANVGQWARRRGSFFGLGDSANLHRGGARPNVISSCETPGPKPKPTKTERRGSFFGLGAIKRRSSHGSQSSFASFDSGNGAPSTKANPPGSFLNASNRRIKSDHSEASFASDDDGGYHIAPVMQRVVSDQSQSTFASFDDSNNYGWSNSNSTGLLTENKGGQRAEVASRSPKRLSLGSLLGGKAISRKEPEEMSREKSRTRRRGSFFGSTKTPASFSYFKDGSSSLASFEAGDVSTDLEPTIPDESGIKRKGSFFGIVRATNSLNRPSSVDSFSSLDRSSEMFARPAENEPGKEFSKLNDSFSTIAVSETPSTSGLLSPA